MRLSAVFTLTALVSAALLGAACSSGGGSRTAFYYPAPVNYNPTAGLSPNLSEGLLTQGPSSTPFKP
jgi:hypothetical protein